MRKILQATLVLGVLSVIPINGQSLIIQGHVLDKNTHRGIPDVNISITGSPVGTSTNIRGQFSLSIAHPKTQMHVNIQHIGYYAQSLPLDSARKTLSFYLQPRIIPLPGVRIQADKDRTMMRHDLPQPVSRIKYDYFEMRGFTDVGDLLQSETSVRIEEELNGKKTLTIRGGNSEDVLILYNGIPLNNSYDNLFDLSLIDLEDIERVELVKGSHTALYGPGAMSGLLNIVPKTEQEYHVRFQQKLGSYNSGRWGLHLNRRQGPLAMAYSYRNGSKQRRFAASSAAPDYLVNTLAHHNVNLKLDLSHTPGHEHSIGLMLLQSQTRHENQRDSENLKNLNQIVSMDYTRNPGSWYGTNVKLALRRSTDQQQLLVYQQLNQREIRDQSVWLLLENIFNFDAVSGYAVYQLNQAKLTFSDELPLAFSGTGLEQIHFNRLHHGFALIGKYHGPTGFFYHSFIDMDVSLRHDRIRDFESRDLIENRAWQKTTVKFATHLNGVRENLTYNLTFHLGSNVRFPTLYQLISQPISDQEMGLRPEKNMSQEMGFDITKNFDTGSEGFGIQLEGNLFRNDYEHKLRTFYKTGIPIVFYDNGLQAAIRGFETTLRLFLWQKKLTLSLGYAKYDISDHLAFPFKSESKARLDLQVDHAGYAFLLHAFYEGDQSGSLLQNDGDLLQVKLDARTDMDVHLSKKFEIFKLKLIANISIRNILNRQSDLLGLAIRDRRYYLTLGIEY